MPRYSVSLRSSIPGQNVKSQYVYAATLSEAERFAERWLEVVRLTAFGPTAWDRWTVAKKLSPHRPPEIVSSGGLSD
jgi:hypothetical protein